MPYHVFVQVAATLKICYMQSPGPQHTHTFPNIMIMPCGTISSTAFVSQHCLLARATNHKANEAFWDKKTSFKTNAPLSYKKH